MTAGERTQRDAPPPRHVLGAALLAGLVIVGCSSGDQDPARSVTSDIDQATSTTTVTVTTTATTGSSDAPESTTSSENTDTLPTTTTEKPADLDGPLVTPDDPDRAAHGLDSTVSCDENDPSVAVADLSWTTAQPQGTRQRVQVTIDPRGFDYGSRLGPELDGSAWSMRWTDISGQAVHSWRVLTKVDGVWLTSPTATFEGPTCAVDTAG